jgi:hypothetical protein
MAKTLPKYPIPSHTEQITLTTPISSVFKQISSVFNKSEQNKLLSIFEEKKFGQLMTLSMQNVKDVEDIILTTLFEDDLIDVGSDEHNRM